MSSHVIYGVPNCAALFRANFSLLFAVLNNPSLIANSAWASKRLPQMKQRYNEPSGTNLFTATAPPVRMIIAFQFVYPEAVSVTRFVSLIMTSYPGVE